jgi:Tfp pilus assembly protein PilE
MAIKFASILAALGMGSTTEAVTEAHLEAADAKIAQLEQAKTDAESKLATAETNLKTAQDEKATAASALEVEKMKTATLEEWKKNQAAVDNREEDDTNNLEGGAEALAPWEKASASAIANAKRRVGEK